MVQAGGEAAILKDRPVWAAAARQVIGVLQGRDRVGRHTFSVTGSDSV